MFQNLNAAIMCSGYKEHSFVTSDRHSYLTWRSLSTGVVCRYKLFMLGQPDSFVSHSLNAADVSVLTNEM